MESKRLLEQCNRFSSSTEALGFKGFMNTVIIEEHLILPSIIHSFRSVY